jgi:hypothetical protein
MRYICHFVSHVRIKQLCSVVFLLRTGCSVSVTQFPRLFEHGIGQEPSPAAALKCVLNIHGAESDCSMRQVRMPPEPKGVALADANEFFPLPDDDLDFPQFGRRCVASL